MPHNTSKNTVTSQITLLVLIAISIAISTHLFFLPPKTINGFFYTHYNNFLIFKNSFFHLFNHQNLYAAYPLEYFDYYKYSPVFAILMAPFALLNNFFGLAFWNLLNTLVLFFGLKQLSISWNKNNLLIIIILLIELITSLQNSQSNALIAGAILIAFFAIEKEQIWLATLLITLTIFIKIFGLFAVLLFLMHPKKMMLKLFSYTLLWVFVFFCLPLLFVPYKEFISLYQNWFALLKHDNSTSIGISFAGIIYAWFNLEAKTFILITGLLLLTAPLILKFKHFSDLTFRKLFLASILIWVVIFNHKAESPTFIIAVTGIAVWFMQQEKTPFNLILLVLTLLLTVLSPTDLFPNHIRKNIFQAYNLKVLPCILVWFKLTYDMLNYNNLTQYIKDETNSIS